MPIQLSSIPKQVDTARTVMAALNRHTRPPTNQTAVYVRIGRQNTRSEPLYHQHIVEYLRRGGGEQAIGSLNLSPNHSQYTRKAAESHINAKNTSRTPSESKSTQPNEAKRSQHSTARNEAASKRKANRSEATQSRKRAVIQEDAKN